MAERGKVVVAGGTGLIGTPLCVALGGAGYEVVRLVRRLEPEGRSRDVLWEGKGTGPWAGELDGAAGVVNLSGRSIACRWSAANRREILDSRVDSTRAIADAIARAGEPPPVWINASAIGIYGERGDEELTEDSKSGEGFLADVCVAWERELFAPRLRDTRRIALRTGIVLARGGGTLPILRRLARSFLGGKIGSGRQWWSAIHVDDLVRLTIAMLEGEVRGPVNATMPKPETNAEFMLVLRNMVGREFGLPAPAFGVRLLGELVGPDGALSLTSARVLPKVAIEAGFSFRHPDLDSALESLLR